MTAVTRTSFFNLSGAVIAALVLWLPVQFIYSKPTTKLLFNTLALGAALYGCAESGKLKQKRLFTRLNAEVEAELAEDFVELEYGRRKAAMQQRYGILPIVEAPQQTALPAAEEVWQPVNPFEHGGAFPVEDLATTLATATNSGTLIIAPSGCGKTRLLQHAIAAAHRHYDGNVDFQVIDCKGEEDGFLGLEKSPNDFCLLDDDTAAQGLGQLMLMKGQLKRADTTIPMVGIIDEWNNGVSSLKNSPDVSKDELQAAISAGRQIVTKGRSKRLYGWMTTHTPETDSIGMDGATRQSFNIIILARGNKLGLISSVLKNTYRFVDDDTTREKLLTAYQHFMSNGDAALKEKPVALTNICGEWRLVRLPDYRDAPEPIDWGVLNGGDVDDEPTPKLPAPTNGKGKPEPASSGRFSPEYLAYLKSPEWQERRERIKPKVCAGCNSTQSLQLHHRIYPRHGATLEDFISQPDAEFSWLCEPCHRSLTQSIRKRRQQK